MNTSRLYAIAGLIALSIFSYYQYRGYGLFDSVANSRSSGGHGSSGHSTYHK